MDLKSYEIYFDKSYQETQSFEVWGAVGGFYTTIRVQGTDQGWLPLFWNLHWERLCRTAEKLQVILPKEDWIYTELSRVIALSSQLFNPNNGGLVRIAINPKGYAFHCFQSRRPLQGLRGVPCQISRKEPRWKLLTDIEIYRKLLSINRETEELLIFDPSRKNILEGATSNLIFKFHDRILISDKNALEGITLSLIRELLEKDGKDCIESRGLKLSELEDVDEIILTGTGKGVSHLTSIPELGWNMRDTKFYNWLWEKYSEIENTYCSSLKK
jgi:branched-subunit amino acid aminotransferase/4-amino-4-deoxychorismate lyase